MAKSAGMQCVSYGCFSYSYKFLPNGERISSDISFFTFPKDPAERKVWCSLIKRANNKDGFTISSSTRVCERHFPPDQIHRPPGGTRKRLVTGARPTLHTWNEYSIGSKRKEPTHRPSPRKRFRSPSTSESDNIQADGDIPAYNSSAEESTSSENINNLFGTEQETENHDQGVEDLSYYINEIQRLKDQITILTKQNSVNKRTEFIDHVLSSDEMCNHYTAFPSTTALRAVFKFLDPGVLGENVMLYNYQKAKKDNVTVGRPRILTPFEAFILTLVRLRRNFDVCHIAFLFNVSEGTVSNTINTWINFMYMRLGSINIWPSREQVKKSMPISMKEKYPNVRCIIDCVEFKVETPSSLFVHKIMYSEYKSHTTVKALVGIAPGGGFTFISNIYPGSISDKEISVKSGLLNKNLWQKGDAIMADRGFLLREYVTPLGVELIIPDFLKGRDQLSIEEAISSQQIANERIHVERMIQRLKCYHIFDRIIPLNMLGSLNQIVTVCALLSNFQEPIMKNK